MRLLDPSRGRGVNPRDLPDRWRDLAARQRELGAEGQACTLEWCSAELEAAGRSYEMESLTLREAASECGYTRDHLARLIREGKIPNVGEPKAPRIRRGDLPRKTSRDGWSEPEDVDSKEQIARSVADSWEGGSDE